jgi:hypothetical protein
VNVNIAGVNLYDSGTTWRYGVTQTTPLETTMATELGNAFTVSIPARSILAVLIDAALPGDFNVDGLVDTADYLFWRKNIGTPEAYEMWRTNFGQTAGAGAVINTAVPEPPVHMLLVAAAAILSAAPSPRRPAV